MEYTLSPMLIVGGHMLGRAFFLVSPTNRTILLYLIVENDRMNLIPETNLYWYIISVIRVVYKIIYPSRHSVCRT